MSEIESTFFAYITEYGKSYGTMAEFEQRLHNFAQKHSFIQAHNAEGHSYKLGLNKMSDWSEEEYKAILTYKKEERPEAEPIEFEGIQTSPVNWVTNGCVSPIQDQGQCGSCWAFSATSSTESAHCIHTNGTLQKFSEQQLVDCVKTCFGCNGGLQTRAWAYLQRHYEMSEASYPYTAKDGNCNYSSTNNTGVQVTSYKTVTANSPDAMKAALATTPLAVAIQADQLVFQQYSSGVFTNTRCGTNLDHATNVVGWGTEDGMDYWLMRNSWGSSWGESGYMKLEIVSGAGLCGIQMEPEYPFTN
jgi:C1A family cysteine protease